MAVAIEDLEELQAATFAVAMLTGQPVATTRAEKNQVSQLDGILHREMVVYVLLLKGRVHLVNVVGN